MGRIGRSYPNTRYVGGSARPLVHCADPAGAFEPARHSITAGVIGLLIVLGFIGGLLALWAS